MSDKEAKRLADLFARDFPGWNKSGGDRLGYYRACTSVIHDRKQLARVIGKKWHTVRAVLGERALDTCSEKVGK